MCYKPGISLPFSDVVYSRIVLSVSDVLQSRNLIVIVQAVKHKHQQLFVLHGWNCIAVF